MGQVGAVKQKKNESAITHVNKKRWRGMFLHFLAFKGVHNFQLVKEALVQEQHAAALDKGPDTSGPDAPEPASDAFGAVDDLEAGDDR